MIKKDGKDFKIQESYYQKLNNTQLMHQPLASKRFLQMRKYQ